MHTPRTLEDEGLQRTRERCQGARRANLDSESLARALERGQRVDDIRFSAAATEKLRAASKNIEKNKKPLERDVSRETSRSNGFLNRPRPSARGQAY